MAIKKKAPKGKPNAGKATAMKTSASKKGKPVAKGKAKPVKSAGKSAKPVAKKNAKGAAGKKPVTAKPVAKKPAKAAAKNSPVKKAAEKKITKVAPKTAAGSKPAPKAPAKKSAVPAKPERIVDPFAVGLDIPVPKPDPKPQGKELGKGGAGGKKPIKERVTMEFYLNSTPTALYELISTPSGFAEWYCQDVDVRGDQYTFLWDQETEETTLIGRKLGEVIRFRRNDDDDNEAFFEFRIRIDAMTNEVALIVTDHAWPDEVEQTRNLWSSQVGELMRVLGA